MNILRTLRTYALGAAAGAIIGIGSGLTIDHLQDASYARAIRAQGETIELDDHGRTVHVTTGPASDLEERIGITGDDAAHPERAIQALTKELEEAGGTYTRACGTSDVRILDDLRLHGADVEGIHTHTNVVYLDGRTLQPRRYVVHELNHQCLAQNMLPYRISWLRRYDGYYGDAWDVAADQRGSDGGGMVATEGFARAYGMKNWREDNATIAEDLILTPLKARRRAAEDVTYGDKLEHVERFYMRLGDPRFRTDQQEEPLISATSRTH